MALLQEARDVLLAEGMASIEEYGDMLKWGLPKKDGMTRNLHVFHPGMCSFEDTYRATIHDHGGRLRSAVLLGGMVHHTYRATADEAGDRTYEGQTYRLERHSHTHHAGTAYRLPARVPHWLEPNGLTLTYFEEEDNGEMGQLLDPIDAGHDEHLWEQPDADAVLPVLLGRIDETLGALRQALPLAAVP